MPRTLFTAAHTTTQAPEAESFSITRSGSSSGITRNRGPGPPLSMMMHVYCVRPFGSTMLAWSLRVVNPIGKMWRSVWNPGRSGSILPCSSNTDSGCWICSWQRPEPPLGYHFLMILILCDLYLHIPSLLVCKTSLECDLRDQRVQADRSRPVEGSACYHHPLELPRHVHIWNALAPSAPLVPWAPFPQEPVASVA